MTIDRNDPAARQKAVLEELDAINTRRERGEITPGEADALGDAVVRRVHEETLALARPNPGRWRDRIELALAYVYLVFALLAGVYCAVLLWRRA